MSIPFSPTLGAVQQLFNNTAGLLVSADPGGGKSVLARRLHYELASAGDACVIVLDPDNDLWEDCLADVAGMPQSVRQRAHAFFPAHPKWPIGAINPLHVESVGKSPYLYEAQIECRSSHTGHLLLSATGRDSFDGAPQLYRFTSTIIGSLARMGMTLLDSTPLFDIGTEEHQLFVDAIPDALAQGEFDRLATLRVDRQDELLTSTKNCFHQVLTSPIVRAHLGAIDRNLPLRELLRQPSLLYFNLSRGDEALSDEAQNFLSNLILSEILHILFTTPRAERRPVIIIADELPVFRSSAMLLARALRRTRKLGLRFVGLAQGTQAFPKGAADPLLQSMVGSCNSVVMGHKNPIDAEFFGKFLSLPTRRTDRVKFEHVEEQQYQSHTEIVTLVGKSFDAAYGGSEGDADSNGTTSTSGEDVTMTLSQSEQHTQTTGEDHGRSDVTGTTDSTQESNSEANNLSAVYDGVRHDLLRESQGNSQSQNRGKSNAKSEQKGITERQSESQSDAVGRALARARGSHQSSGWKREATHNQARNWSKSESHSISQHILPVLAWRKIIRLELMSFAEQDQDKATKISLLRPGEAFFYIAGVGVVRSRIQAVKNELLSLPKSLAFALSRLYGEMFEADFCQLPERVLAQRAEFERQLFNRLRADANRRIRLLETNELNAPTPKSVADYSLPGLTF